MIRVFKNPNSDDVIISYDDDDLRLLDGGYVHGERVTEVPNWWVEYTPTGPVDPQGELTPKESEDITPSKWVSDILGVELAPWQKEVVDLPKDDK